MNNIECVSCFDRYVLEYFINGAFVHIEKTKPITINNLFSFRSYGDFSILRNRWF